MNRHIAILGAGNMASALALSLARHKRPIRLYCIEPDVEAELNNTRCNTKYLPGVKFPATIKAFGNLESVVPNAKEIFIAVPSFAVKELIERACPMLAPDAILASFVKGLDAHTLEPLILTQRKALPALYAQRLATVGGPAIANEIAKNAPTGIVVASELKPTREIIKKLLETDTLKVATSDDMAGVSAASALKNPYAIALGMCDGLKYPTNAKALIFTIALQEIAELLSHMNAKPETAYGLAGAGDLLVTGFSPHGRNRAYGERLAGAKSKAPSDLNLITVEGIATTELATQLAHKYKVKTPLLLAIQACLRAKSHFTRPFESFIRTLHLF